MPNEKISQLPSAAALAGTELLSGVQAGANVNITPTQLKAYMVVANIALSGTSWDINANPYQELSLSANDAINIVNGVAGKSRGFLLVNNTGTFTLSLNGTSISIGNSGYTAITVVCMSTGAFLVTTQAAQSVTGQSPLASPTVSFGSGTSSSIVVNWSNVTNATNYIVKRNTTNTITGATQIYSGGLLTFTDTGLSSGVTYYYFVIAQATGFPDSSPGTGSQTTGATTLNAPVLTAGTPTASTVPLTWTDTNTTPNESSFEIQQSADGGTTWVAASPNTAAANATGATPGSLTASTAYQFRVRAVGDGTTTTTSTWSNIVSATTAAAAEAPYTISGLVADYNGDNATNNGTGGTNSWPDSTGNGHTLSTSGTGGTLVAADLNGHQTVRFGTSTNTRLINSTFNLSQPYTVVLIAAITGSADQVLFDTYTEGGGAADLFYSGGSLGLNDGTVLSTSFTPSATFKFLVAQANGATSSLQIGNGTPVTGASGADGLAGISVGDIRGNPTVIAGNNYFIGKYARILIYSRALNSTEITTLYNYVGTKYGVS